MITPLPGYSSNLPEDTVTQILSELTEAFSGLAENGLVSKLIATTILITAAFVIRWIGARVVRRFEHVTSQTRRRWLVGIRNAVLIFLLIGLIGVWAETLRVLAYSLFAIAVATVIATKELILCLTGSFLKSSSRSFKLGDRIEIGTIRGEVIDHTALTTTLLEIGSENVSQQPTGRAITIPNSLLLDKPVVNESFTNEFVLHLFKIPCKFDDQWTESEADLLKAARAECHSYLAEAKNHFSRLSRKEGLTHLSVEPRVTVRFVKADELEFQVRIAVPARKKSRVEQAILRRYLERENDRRLLKKAKSAESEDAEKPDLPSGS